MVTSTVVMFSISADFWLWNSCFSAQIVFCPKPVQKMSPVVHCWWLWIQMEIDSVHLTLPFKTICEFFHNCRPWQKWMWNPKWAFVFSTKHKHLRNTRLVTVIISGKAFIVVTFSQRNSVHFNDGLNVLFLQDSMSLQLYKHTKQAFWQTKNISNFYFLLIWIN